MTVKLLRQIASPAEYHKLFIKYEVLVNSTVALDNDKIEELESLIGEYEEATNITPKTIEHNELLYYFLDESGMTQCEFANRLGVSQPLINRILNDDIQISKKLAFKLSEEFKVNRLIFQRVPKSTKK